jgi:hypothetical protein
MGGAGWTTTANASDAVFAAEVRLAGIWCGDRFAWFLKLKSPSVPLANLLVCWI